MFIGKYLKISAFNNERWYTMSEKKNLENKAEKSPKRCAWVDLKNSRYIEYHDYEWGVPVHDDRRLFEMLILEGAQAGLSWATILNKRENYRLAFDNFEPSIVADYDEIKIDELLGDKGIVRNRRKIYSAINNARVFLDIQEEFGSFSAYIWSFVDGQPIQNSFKEMVEVPCETELSETISKDLKKRGMSFVGPTIIYSFMQAVGMVNDHETGCFRHDDVRNIEFE